MKRKATTTVIDARPTKDASIPPGPVVATFTTAPADPSALRFHAFFHPSADAFGSASAAAADASVAGADEEEGSRKKVAAARRTRMVTCEGAEGGAGKVVYRSEVDEGEEAFCRYAVALYDPATSTLTIAPSPALRVIAKPKALSRSEQQLTHRTIGQKDARARIGLGETFGTVKRKQQIRALERNKLTDASLGAVDGVLREAIDKSGEKAGVAGMARDERHALEDENRPIPNFNRHANDAEGVYDMEDLAPHQEIRTISVRNLLKLKTTATIQEQIKGAPSWIVERIGTTLSEGSGEGDSAVATRVRQFMYLWYLIRFFKATEAHLNNQKKGEAYFQGISSIVLESLVNRFAEPAIDGGPATNLAPTATRYKLPERLKDKLLAYIFALAIKLEPGLRVEVSVWAEIMNIPIAKARSIFRELGCKVDTKKSGGEEGVGAGAGVERWAILALPLSFPVKTR
ncbi:DNA-directed RNA polymerase I subunit rpa49 [Phlyctochytrium bullatum]|nr:DNA-directed RNA polymerase I subunit rpa49 [Phlyctochytrium bullatum]